MSGCVFKKRYGRDKNGKKRIDPTYRAKFKCAWMSEPKIVRLGVRSKQVADQLLQELIKEEERAQFGAVPRDIKHYATIPLEQHLQDFLSVVKSWGRSPKHLYYLGFHCRQIISFCRWQYPKDINLFDFEKWRSSTKFSAKTKNHYLGALREFCRWMVLHNRMMVDPINHAKKLDLRRVQKNHRRALTVEQLQQLLDVLPLKLHCIVLLAVYTGLRRGEISKLTWDDLCLDSADPMVVAPSSITKNGQKAVIPLRAEVVAALLEYRSQSSGQGLVFGRFPEFGRLRKYWLAAGIPAELNSGYDFHSLRGTFCTLLNVAGNAPRVVQEAMRHSSSQLTEHIYTDSVSLDIRAAIETLPSVTNRQSAAPKAALTAVKTGVLVTNADKNEIFEEKSEGVFPEHNRQELSEDFLEKKWRRERDLNPR